MASATPAASVWGKSPSAPEEKGLRGLKFFSGVADRVIEVSCLWYKTMFFAGAYRTFSGRCSWDPPVGFLLGILDLVAAGLLLAIVGMLVAKVT
jgi:hypothetical protein